MIFRWVGTENSAADTPENEEGWERIPGSAKTIAIGAEGSIYMLEDKKVPGGYRIKKRQESAQRWYIVGGGARQLSVGPDGKPYVITNSGGIYWPEEACPEKINWHGIAVRQFTAYNSRNCPNGSRCQSVRGRG